MATDGRPPSPDGTGRAARGHLVAARRVPPHNHSLRLRVIERRFTKRAGSFILSATAMRSSVWNYWRVAAWAGVFLSGGIVRAGSDDPGEAARSVWTAHVEQIFADHCTKCHAGVKQKGGVDLRTPQTVLKGGDDGPIVVPGNAVESKLFKALRVDSDPHMPPEGSKQLTEQEVAIVQRWIEKLPSTNQPAGPIGWRSSAYAATEPVKIPTWAAKIDVSKAVDRFVEEGWKKRNVKAATLASD